MVRMYELAEENNKLVALDPYADTTCLLLSAAAVPARCVDFDKCEVSQQRKDECRAGQRKDGVAGGMVVGVRRRRGSRRVRGAGETERALSLCFEPR
jgi:hypothetical protein